MNERIFFVEEFNEEIFTTKTKRELIAHKNIVVNPSIADTAIFNAYHRQENVWQWF